MDILERIKKEWNFKESPKENVIRFSNSEESNRKRRTKNNIFNICFALSIGIVSYLMGVSLPLIPLIIGAIVFSSPVNFSYTGSLNIYKNQIAYIDSTHFVFAYSENGGPGKAVIGTISGENISFGTAYQFQSEGDSSSSSIAVEVMDSTHFVILWSRDWYSQSKSVVGTISNGNEISYGSIVQFFASDYAYYPTVKKINSTTFVATFVYNNDTTIKALVGTISNGNELSYGSVSTLAGETSNGHAGYSDLEIIDSSKFIFSFINSSSYKASLVVGNISGTNITWGSVNANINESGFGGQMTDICLLSSDTAIISYGAYDNVSYLSSYGAARIVTISGDSISALSDEVKFTPDAGSWDLYPKIMGCYPITTSKFLLVYLKEPGGMFTSPKYGVAKYGTVSGSTISFGDEESWFNNTIGGNSFMSAIDSTNQLIVTYQDSTAEYPYPQYFILGDLPAEGNTKYPMPTIKRG